MLEYLVEWYFDGVEWPYDKAIIGVYDSLDKVEGAIKKVQDENSDLYWLSMDRKDFKVIEMELNKEKVIRYDASLR